MCVCVDKNDLVRKDVWGRMAELEVEGYFRDKRSRISQDPNDGVASRLSIG